MFTTLEITNFKGQTRTVSLAPHTTVIGNNGTGKSTMLEALYMALTGALPGERASSDLYRELAGPADDGRWTVTLTAADGSTITRQWLGGQSRVRVQRGPDSDRNADHEAEIAGRWPMPVAVDVMGVLAMKEAELKTWLMDVCGTAGMWTRDQVLDAVTEAHCEQIQTCGGGRPLHQYGTKDLPVVELPADLGDPVAVLDVVAVDAAKRLGETRSTIYALGQRLRDDLPAEPDVAEVARLQRAVQEKDAAHAAAVEGMTQLKVAASQAADRARRGQKLEQEMARLEAQISSDRERLASAEESLKAEAARLSEVERQYRAILTTTRQDGPYTADIDEQIRVSSMSAGSQQEMLESVTAWRQADGDLECAKTRLQDAREKTEGVRGELRGVKKRHELLAGYNGVCPACGQATDSVIVGMATDVAEMNVKVSSAEDELKLLEGQFDEAKDKAQRAHKEKIKLEQKIQANRDLVTKQLQEERNARIRSHKESVAEVKSLGQQVDKSKDRVRRLQEEIRAINLSEESLTAQLRRIEEEHAELVVAAADSVIPGYYDAQIDAATLQCARLREEAVAAAAASVEMETLQKSYDVTMRRRKNMDEEREFQRSLRRSLELLVPAVAAVRARVVSSYVAPLVDGVHAIIGGYLGEFSAQFSPAFKVGFTRQDSAGNSVFIPLHRLSTGERTIAVVVILATAMELQRERRQQDGDQAPGGLRLLLLDNIEALDDRNIVAFKAMIAWFIQAGVLNQVVAAGFGGMERYAVEGGAVVDIAAVLDLDSSAHAGDGEEAA